MGFMLRLVVMKKMKFKVVTLGCRTNQYESESYVDQLKKMGFIEALEGEEAELCIVNTCTVTQSADSHSRQQIRSLKRKNPHAKLVVTGCMVESHRKDLEKMSEVDLLVPNQKKEELLSFVFPEEVIPEFGLTESSSHTRAFVKIQDGCSSFCTYCILPYVRGRSRSRKVPDILEEIQRLIQHGKKEVVLTGINVGDFDGANSVRLVDLVKQVDKLEGLERVRISSIDPDEVDEELLEAVVFGKKTCHSMHIVLQSGSNVILKRMNRKYTKQIFLNTVERLKKSAPDFTFTTDVIVGFPGETEEDFEETMEVIEEVGFAKVHMFPYSERERTRAALYPNKVPKSVIAERKQKVLRLSEKRAFDLRDRYVGRKMEVLLEGPSSGYTGNFLPVDLLSQGAPNQLMAVEIVSNSPEGLKGRIV